MRKVSERLCGLVGVYLHARRRWRSFAIGVAIRSHVWGQAQPIGQSEAGRIKVVESR